jgi:hypothetical protein
MNADRLFPVLASQHALLDEMRQLGRAVERNGKIVRLVPIIGETSKSFLR